MVIRCVMRKTGDIESNDLKTPAMIGNTLNISTGNPTWTNALI